LTTLTTSSESDAKRQKQDLDNESDDNNKSTTSTASTASTTIATTSRTTDYKPCVLFVFRKSKKDDNGYAICIEPMTKKADELWTSLLENPCSDSGDMCTLLSDLATYYFHDDPNPWRSNSDLGSHVQLLARLADEGDVKIADIPEYYNANVFYVENVKEFADPNARFFEIIV
jgi:hypothetical protein